MKTKVLILSILCIAITYSAFSSEECSCDPGKYLDLELKKCEPNPTADQPSFIKGCTDYIADYNDLAEHELTCTKCQPGKFLKSPKECQEFTIDNCLNAMLYVPPVDENADPADAQDGEEIIHCSHCSQNYYPKESSCVPYPTSDGEAIGHVSFCLEYGLNEDNEQICVLCIDGETFDKEEDETACHPGSIQNCQKYESPTKCMQCEDGFVIHAEKTHCYPMPTGAKAQAKCEQYTTFDGEEFKCQECSGDTWLEFYEGICRPIDSDLDVDHCVSYLSSAMCIKCKTGYFAPFPNTCLQCPPMDGSAAVESFYSIDEDDDDSGDDKADEEGSASVLGYSVLLLLILTILQI